MPPVQWVLGLSGGVNCLEHGDYHPPPSGAGLQMCQSYTSVSPLYLHRHIVGLPELMNNYIM